MLTLFSLNKTSNADITITLLIYCQLSAQLIEKRFDTSTTLLEMVSQHIIQTSQKLLPLVDLSQEMYKTSIIICPPIRRQASSTLQKGHQLDSAECDQYTSWLKHKSGKAET